MGMVALLGTPQEEEPQIVVPMADVFVDAPGLMPGMFGVLELPMGTRTAVVVPEDAVVRVGQLEYVHAQLGERTARLLVRTIPAGAGRREVVTGAFPGMTIYR